METALYSTCCSSCQSSGQEVLNKHHEEKQKAPSDTSKKVDLEAHIQNAEWVINIQGLSPAQTKERTKTCGP